MVQRTKAQSKFSREFMKPTTFLAQYLYLPLAVVTLASTGIGVRAQTQEKSPASVEALVYSTMPSRTEHRPEMALDNDKATYFKSVYSMDDGDVFLVLLSRSIPVQALHVLSGDSEGKTLLTDATVETSADAVHFDKVAAFDARGAADAMLTDKTVLAVRIRLNPGKEVSALALRDITITSTTKISHVQLGPGRGFYDLSEAPDLTDWARKAEQQMEEFWPDMAALLYSDRFLTPNMVQVVYRTGPDVTPVAATGGGVMTVNSAWCRLHPEDTGLTVHETAHVIQASSAYNPVWLIEGVADYIRWIKFEPQNYHVRINPATATYHDSYRTTATFLAWCELHYDSRLVTKLNDDVRFGKYTSDRFRQYCGKDVDTLWSEFIAAYRADPAYIIVPQVAPEDKPRPLPAVKAGTSKPVDLSKSYNLRGIYKDGEQFRINGGFDEGGASYSANLLGTTQTQYDVKFDIGGTATADTVICQGQVIALPAGSFGSLWLLGSAVEGSQKAQKFIVTYADGTTEKFVQNISDWYYPQNFAGENRAVTMAYRNSNNGEKDPRTFLVYCYGFPLKTTRSVKSITLPDSPNVRLLAITLSN